MRGVILHLIFNSAVLSLSVALPLSNLNFGLSTKPQVFVFFRITRTDFKLRASIFHTLSLIQSSVSLSFTLMQTKLIEKINPFMLCMPDKFLYQNQQQTPDTSHFTLTRKSFHTSCRLQIVSTRFVSNVDQ